MKRGHEEEDPFDFEEVAHEAEAEAESFEEAEAEEDAAAILDAQEKYLAH